MVINYKFCLKLKQENGYSGHDITTTTGKTYKKAGNTAKKQAVHPKKLGNSNIIHRFAASKPRPMFDLFAFLTRVLTAFMRLFYPAFCLPEEHALSVPQIPYVYSISLSGFKAADRVPTVRLVGNRSG